MEPKKKHFVLGFAHDQHGRVLLMQKTRPNWQKGQLNGIGGKVEKGEDIFHAMTRECKEETGLELEWEWMGTRVYHNKYKSAKFNAHVEIFRSVGNPELDYTQKEDELLSLYPVLCLPLHKCVDDVVEFANMQDKPFKE